jgi:predicted transcriptional regulator
MRRLNADEWLDVLSNKHRRKILRLCSIRPCYPQEISRLLDLTPTAVIKHLQELEKNNLIVKREETRSEGGRPIQYYHVPFRPRFNFNLASKDLIDIEIVDETDKSVPETHSRNKLLDRESFKDEIGSIKSNYKILINHEKEKIEAFRKLRKLQHEQERFFKTIQSKNSSQQQILFKIIRFLIDRFGFDKTFSHQDIMDGLGIDLDSAEEIIQILSIDLDIISKTSSKTESSLPLWIINPIENIPKLDYF